MTIDEYNDSRDLYKKDPSNYKLRPHQIQCKNNQTIISLSIPNSQIRILVNIKDCSEDEAVYVFSWIGKHREYERIIKDKKNCKSLFLSCEDLEKLLLQQL